MSLMTCQSWYVIHVMYFMWCHSFDVIHDVSVMWRISCDVIYLMSLMWRLSCDVINDMSVMSFMLSLEMGVAVPSAPFTSFMSSTRIIRSCHVTLCHVVPCSMASCHTMSCHSMSCNAVSYHTMSCRLPVSFFTSRNNTALFLFQNTRVSTAQYCGYFQRFIDYVEMPSLNPTDGHKIPSAYYYY